jgi:hypothetical protein
VGLNFVRYRLPQIIYSSYNAQTPSRALTSVSPSSAEQLLSSIYTSPGTSYFPSYLVIIGGTAHSGGVSSNLDGELDGIDWDALEKRCKECDVRVSCVCTGERSAAERLRRLVETASPGGLEDPWFATPPDTQVFLSGLAIDPGEFPQTVPRLTRSHCLTITSASPGCSSCSGRSSSGPFIPTSQARRTAEPSQHASVYPGAGSRGSEFKWTGSQRPGHAEPPGSGQQWQYRSEQSSDAANQVARHASATAAARANGHESRCDSGSGGPDRPAACEGWLCFRCRAKRGCGGALPEGLDGRYHLADYNQRCPEHR